MQFLAFKLHIRYICSLKTLKEVPCYILFRTSTRQQQKQFVNTDYIDKDLFLFHSFIITDDDSYLVDALLFLAWGSKNFTDRKFKGNSGDDVINIFARSFHLISPALIMYAEIQKFAMKKLDETRFAFHVWTRIYFYNYTFALVILGDIQSSITEVTKSNWSHRRGTIARSFSSDYYTI